MRFTNQDFPAGALRLHLEDRTGSGNGGPAIRVYGPATDGNADAQLLRFDCFAADPHYHFDPDGRDECIHLHGNEGANSVTWSLTQLRQHLPDLIRRAGGTDEAIAAAATPKAAAAIEQLADQLQ